MEILNQSSSNLLIGIRDKFVYTKWLRSLKVLINRICNKAGVALVVYNTPKAEKIIKLINRLKDENVMLLQTYEAYQIFKAVEDTKKIPGDIAEVGVYKGGSAKIICEAKGLKKLHLFDTFEGLPYQEENMLKGEVRAELVTVKNALKNEDVILYKGIFPLSAGPVENKKFSFVHLDVDLYRSTIDCLEFFYPRMSKGGIIISHDYFSPSVKRAFDEFFKNKPEPIIDLNVSQCLISKL